MHGRWWSRPRRPSRSHPPRRLRPGPAGADGTDLVEVDETRTVVAHQPRFSARVFTPGERAYCDIPAGEAERYVARFTAKEAVLNAGRPHRFRPDRDRGGARRWGWGAG
ncbi:4'-phosphopantetheinyl transferase superfamily protein [Streptomyces sp. NPDC057027]|uniref:4'-phosphopantetheinyl transferase superfamily protein n=1 Tax=Streptomyces sp. NPDC057027 TaxID=3346004 RepID=UPI0036262B20